MIEAAGWTVIGDAGDGFELLSMVEDQEPDLVIMDLGMPNLGGRGSTKTASVKTAYKQRKRKRR